MSPALLLEFALHCHHAVLRKDQCHYALRDSVDGSQHADVLAPFRLRSTCFYSVERQYEAFSRNFRSCHPIKHDDETMYVTGFWVLDPCCYKRNGHRRSVVLSSVSSCCQKAQKPKATELGNFPRIVVGVRWRTALFLVCTRGQRVHACTCHLDVTCMRTQQTAPHPHQGGVSRVQYLVGTF